MGHTVIGFDAKSFRRGMSGSTTDGSQSERRDFYTPLGVGVEVCSLDEFETEYRSAVGALSESFNLRLRPPCYDSTTLKRELGMRRAIPFADELVTRLQPFIERLFVSYVILPPSTISEVRVGGHHSLEKTIGTEEFLRKLEPAFSYLTAWAYLNQRRKEFPDEVPEIRLDGFASKETTAWHELTSWSTPLVYSRGDECNALLATADITAFLTDVKLYGQEDYDRRRLKPENVKHIWDGYDFQVNVRFLDQYRLRKFKWTSEAMIDIRPHIARPIVFMLMDDINKASGSLVNESALAGGDHPGPSFRRKKPEFRLGVEPYLACLHYANKKNGCVRFFDRNDSNLITDGDVMVYMGPQSKRICEVFQDGFDVKVFRSKDLRKKMKV
jgi:hypothetical protein